MNHTTVFQEDVTEAVSLVAQDKFDKANITEQALVQLREDLLPLTEHPIQDEARLALVQGGLTRATKMRTTIVKICKAGRDEALKEQRAWLATEKELVAEVEKVEAPLRARKAEWQDEQDRIEREVMEAKQAKINGRILALEEMGFVRQTANGLDPDRYVLGDCIIPLYSATTSEDAEWEGVERVAMTASAEVKQAKAKEEAARIEAQRLAKEEADKQAAIAAENDRKTKEIEAREAAMNAKVEEVRTNEIKAVGANGMEAPMRPYAIYTEEHWTEEIDRTKAKVAARLQAEETAKQQAEMERVAREEKIRAEAANTERMRLEKEAKDKAEAEQERLRQAGDKGVIENLRNCLQTTMELMEGAEVSSAIAKHGLSKAQGHLSNAISVMIGTLGDMK